MTNAVTAPNKGPSQQELLARLAKSVEASKTNTLSYMSFNGREGKFVVSNGTDEPDEFAKGQTVLVSLFDSKQGYACWKDGKPIDSVHYGLFDTLPDESTLEDHGPYSTDPQKREGWKLTYTVILKEPTSGKQYQLQLSSPSATRAFGAFMKEVIEQGAMHDFYAETPVVVLNITRFESKGHKNYKPDFELTGWKANPTAAAAITDQSAAEEAPAEAISSSRKK
jgi:hypothetical protein